MNRALEHSHFEELRALASIGEISPAEYQELANHMRECASCRSSYAGHLRLTHVQLPLVVAEESRPATTPAGFFQRLAGKDYKARFAARAKERGLQISVAPQEPQNGFRRRWAGVSIPRLSYQHAFVAVIVVLVGVAGMLSHRSRDAEARGAALAAQVAKLAEQNVALRQQMNALSHGKQAVESDLLNTRTDNTALSVHLRELEDQVKKDSLALESLQGLPAQLAAANTRGAQAEQKLREAQQTLQAAHQELAELRSARANVDDSVVTSQQFQVASLSRRLKDQEELIDKQQKLLAVDADVRNLMAARSLHITDVFDVDGKGKKKSAFGRVFYTEGKSLIFYAFDLEGPKVTAAKHSFQAWGQRSDSSTSAVNLGIFYVDDAAQKRWMLRFDNPEVLRQLSAVFVTAEPHGGGNRPTGQKLMYAYLGHEPNHP